jgi:prepilin-type N-terminal cleavage/methylation domain-containing protein
VEQVNLRGFWQSEQGFSILEVAIVITVMTIVLAIASSTWFDAVESRRVDSATNQVVSDLHLAHTTATNRLANHEVRLTANSNTYQIGPTPDDDPDTPDQFETRTLVGMEGLDPDEDTEGTIGTPVSDTTLTIVFEPDGSASATPAESPICFQVQSADGAPFNTIEINTTTSMIEVSTNAC